MLLYYSGIETEEVSRFIPTLSTTTIFTVLIAFLVLGEKFTVPVYIGIISVVAGAVLISMKDLQHFKSSRGFVLAITAALFFAFRNIFLKFSTGGTELWSVLFWAGIGGFIVSSAFLSYHRSRIGKVDQEGEEHLLFIGFLSALGYFAYSKSISLGTASLASAVLKVKILLVFMASMIISKLHPEIIEEDMDRITILQKALAALLILGGVVAIQLLS
jgi:drug/metabolite transporter (DMT)-like permease